MRLIDLEPQIWAVYRDRDKTPDRGGFPTGEIDLAFTCPSCGKPTRLFIRLGPKAEEPSAAYPYRRWAWNKPLGDGAGWLDQLTVTPSIDNTCAGHGPRRPPCRFHGSIVNGEVKF